MGVSSSFVSSSEFLKNIPNDQYACINCECKCIPEITRLDFNKGIITYKCKIDDIENVDIRKYFKEESKNIYHNIKCDKDNKRLQKDNLSYIFNHFIQTGQNLCQNCSEYIKSPSIKVNELNNICPTHLNKYIKYCKECNKHFCDQDIIQCGHYPEKIKQPNDKEIELIKSKKNYLLKLNEINDYLIKFLDTLITTYEQHPSNYFNSINVINIAKDIEKHSNEYLLNKIEMLEKKVLSILNDKFEVNLSKEVKNINLNGKKVNNFDLKFLSLIHFKNLEELDLGNNNISNIEPIENLSSNNLNKINLSNNQIKNIEPLKNFSNLKDINLSLNKIEDISPLNEIMNKNKLLEKINLNDNNIKNVEILKNNIPKSIKSIFIGGKNAIKEDFEEIKNILKKDIDYIIYLINSNESRIRLFGEEFVKKNKEKFNIIINDNKSELIEYYNCEKDEKILKVQLIMIENITNMSDMFNGCSSLSSLDGISDLETRNVTNMSKMFNECSSLTSLDKISRWKTGKVTNMSEMFSKCSSLTSLYGISKWNTKNVTNMSYMFSECSSLSSLDGISKWDTGKVNDMSSMFSKCPSLLSLEGLLKWETENVNDMSFMFSECSSLSSLDGISKWDTRNVKDMSFMFSECSSLLSLDGLSEWETENVNDMNSTFSKCSSLLSLDGILNWDTGNVTNMKLIFYGCQKLSLIPPKFKN